MMTNFTLSFDHNNNTLHTRARVCITQQYYIDRCQACYCVLCMRFFMQANKIEKGEIEISSKR